IPVTTDVAVLAPAQVHRALDAGADRAEALQRNGLVWSVVLVCQGQWRVLQPLSSTASPGLPRTGREPMADAVGSVFA
ncbi:MAG TPA: UPF0280 family protein, partial [Burkholderiaceae bacterium]|nr:UPF0280 family protein [Burkholderiaceae bacterium]